MIGDRLFFRPLDLVKQGRRLTDQTICARFPSYQVEREERGTIQGVWRELGHSGAVGDGRSEEESAEEETKFEVDAGQV